MNNTFLIKTKPNIAIIGDISIPPRFGKNFLILFNNGSTNLPNVNINLETYLLFLFNISKFINQPAMQYTIIKKLYKDIICEANIINGFMFILYTKNIKPQEN